MFKKINYSAKHYFTGNMKHFKFLRTFSDGFSLDEFLDKKKQKKQKKVI